MILLEVGDLLTHNRFTLPEIKTLEVLFLLRHGTFEGSAGVLAKTWPQHSLATMNYIIWKHRQRWSALTLKCSGEAYLTRLKAAGLVEQDLHL